MTGWGSEQVAYEMDTSDDSWCRECGSEDDLIPLELGDYLCRKCFDKLNNRWRRK